MNYSNSPLYWCAGILFLQTVVTATALHQLQHEWIPTKASHEVQERNIVSDGIGFIVKLKDGVNQSSLTRALNASLVTAEYDIFNGFAGIFGKLDAASLKSNPNIEYIGEDTVYHLNPVNETKPILLAKNRRDNAEQLLKIRNYWNLRAISGSKADQQTGPYNYTYPKSGGSGVDVYVLDSGIYAGHSQFSGRATLGKSFSGSTSDDDNGHGTHVAALIAGATFGVAPKANIIAVKIMNSDGQARISHIISAISWVIDRTKSSRRPSIINISLSGKVNPLLDQAVVAAHKAGIHVVIAAGNKKSDASLYSPGRVADPLTVGASDLNNQRAEFSNYGKVVDIWAPGSWINSAWIGSPNATNIKSGTSQAAPLVAGVVALWIGSAGNKSPAKMVEMVTSGAKELNGLRIVQIPSTLCLNDAMCTSREL